MYEFFKRSTSIRLKSDVHSKIGVLKNTGIFLEISYLNKKTWCHRSYLSTKTTLTYHIHKCMHVHVF